MRKTSYQNQIEGWRKMWEPASVGFQDFFTEADALLGRIVDKYPPYNMTMKERQTRIEVALAGLPKEEISVYVEESLLHIKHVANQEQVNSEESWTMVHQGISRRSFDLTFKLEKDVQVLHAEIKDGLLTILLQKQEPLKTIQTIEVK